MQVKKCFIKLIVYINEISMTIRIISRILGTHVHLKPLNHERGVLLNEEDRGNESMI